MFKPFSLSHHFQQRLASGVLAMALMASLMPTAAQAPIDLRVALVIGNAAYPGVAALANPGNDAKAMGDALRGLGFSVVEARDASRAQMQEAIAKVRDQLKGKNGIGMLYYAGHGLQVDWRNYMVPVDAKMNNASDVPNQTVELASVIDAFKQAGNRMNIVVLDACRDNPFQGTATAKGLAQLDAPPGTFLAFATAPGNVAEDGDKASNGLYTRYLLQELKKPQAKIEDVFKRVRLNVRQQSDGRQIPWESTSLEEDFYFGKTSKLSPEEIEKQYQIQFDRWASVQTTKDTDLLQAFLLDFPNGAFSELAQFRLDRLIRERLRLESERQAALKLEAERKASAQALIEKAKQDELAKQAKALAQAAQIEAERLAQIQQRDLAEREKKEAVEKALSAKKEAQRLEEEARVASLKQQEAERAAARTKLMEERKLEEETSKLLAQRLLSVAPRQNPGSRDSDAIPLNRAYSLGQTATQTETRWSNKTEEVLRYRVTKVTDDFVELNGGRVVWDLMGNVLANRNGRNSVPRQFYPAELQVGKRWVTRFSRERPDGRSDQWDMSVKVAGRETIKVPAGAFETYVIKASGWRKMDGKNDRFEWKIWVAPNVAFDIAREYEQRSDGRLVDMVKTQLTSFEAGRTQSQ
jgi:Caspase domain